MACLDQMMESIAEKLKKSERILILDGLDKLPQAARLLRPFQKKQSGVCRLPNAFARTGALSAGCFSNPAANAFRS